MGGGILKIREGFGPWRLWPRPWRSRSRSWWLWSRPWRAHRRVEDLENFPLSVCIPQGSVFFSMISFAGFSTIGATQRFSKSKAKPGRLVLYLFSENELEGTPKINFCNCSCVQFCRFFHDQQSALQTRL